MSFFFIVSDALLRGGQKQRSHSCLFRNATILLSNTEPTPHIVIIRKQSCAGENKKRYRCCCCCCCGKTFLILVIVQLKINVVLYRLSRFHHVVVHETISYPVYSFIKIKPKGVCHATAAI